MDPLIAEVARMRQQYLARGGNDPGEHGNIKYDIISELSEILRQMTVMETEALEMAAVSRSKVKLEYMMCTHKGLSPTCHDIQP